MLTHYVKGELNIDQPTLIMLHGFISDHTTFHLVEDKIVNNDINIIEIDLPGHGQDKSRIDDEWSMPFIAQQLLEVIEYYNLNQVFLHGYSMGGRVALSFAIQHPQVLKGLILESASPGIQDNDEKQKRIEVDKNRAQLISEIGVTEFVNEWEQLPLFNTQNHLASEERKRIRKMRLSQNPKGLSKSLIDYGTGSQTSYWAMLDQLQTPVCIIVGSEDEKFVNIGSKMNNCFKNSELHIVKEAGHTIHVEQPTKFDTIIVEFILGGTLCQDNGKR